MLSVYATDWPYAEDDREGVELALDSESLSITSLKEFGASVSIDITSLGVTCLVHWSSRAAIWSPTLRPHLPATLPGTSLFTIGYPLLLTNVMPMPFLPCCLWISILCSSKPGGG